MRGEAASLHFEVDLGRKLVLMVMACGHYSGVEDGCDLAAC